MNILNLFRKKKTDSVDLSKLENHFILRVGKCHCDTCKQQTMNCSSVTVGEQTICVCPKKDVKGFRKPKL